MPERVNRDHRWVLPGRPGGAHERLSLIAAAPRFAAGPHQERRGARPAGTGYLQLSGQGIADRRAPVPALLDPGIPLPRNWHGEARSLAAFQQVLDLELTELTGPSA